MFSLARRLVLLTVVCVVSAGAGSAVLASPAFAGGVDSNSMYLSGALYNLTPYTLTKVAEASPATCYSYNSSTNQYFHNLTDCWAFGEPAATIAPGGAGGYTLAANSISISRFGTGAGFESGYDGWVTYRVDVLGGAPEYVTFTISQAYDSGDYGSGGPRLDVWDTTAPPPAGYDPGSNPNPPAAQTPNPQVTYSHNNPYQFDQTFQIAGDYTVDASTDLGKPFVDVLNAMCADAKNTSCSFTQTSPLTWGIGDPSPPFSASNCVLSGAQLGDEPNYFSVGYEAAQSASLSVGGGITASAEFKLFDVVGNEVSVSIEAEHEWQEVKSLARTSKVYIPDNDIAFLWVVPVVGKVTGTLVVSNGAAKFTATNFTEVRSGVTKDALTPAFNVITKVRPMTAAEIKGHCGGSQGTTGLGASQPTPVKLAQGQPVTGVKLGQTQAEILKELGRPMARSFPSDPCQDLDRACDAVPGTGGRWSYRHLSVVFGQDLRVSGLIYTGPRRSTEHVGVGSSWAAVRGAYPEASCSRSGRQKDCTLTGAYGGFTVKTVYQFIKKTAGRYRCNRVLTYLTSVTDDPAEVKS